MTSQNILKRIREETAHFYRYHTEIKASHGFKHVLAVYNHTEKAIACHRPALTSSMAMAVKSAALLHDVDDKKYFPNQNEEFENALKIMARAEVPNEISKTILDMIRLVSCSSNGNDVPSYIIDEGKYHLLIPRWSDRLEAVGKIGIVRAYQYNIEHGGLLSSSESPRAQTREEVWNYTRPERFIAYTSNGGNSTDMISHFYDKLLHIARPPRDLVRNEYLERTAEDRSEPLVELCVRFGKTGEVDKHFIEDIASSLSISMDKDQGCKC